MININSCDDDKMDFIISKLSSIEQKLDLLINEVNTEIKPNCNRMNKHIDFIEKVYNVVKSPLGFMCERVNYLTKNKTYSLDDNNNDNDDK
jgi:hypothetical protein